MESELSVTPTERAASGSQSSDAAKSRAIGFGISIVVIAACWAAAGNAMERWFAPWGSHGSFLVFVGAIALWLGAVGQSIEKDDGWLQISAPWFLTTNVLLVLYAALYPWVPQLVSCELAAAALACAMLSVLPRDIRSRCWGIAVLVLLSMHVSTSVEFFVGYPLRVLSTWLAAAMLGPVAQSYGTGLTDGVNLYYVDAPCSGIHMLTYSLIMAAGAAALLRLSPGRTIMLLIAAAAVAVFGNAHRASTLFFIDEPDGGIHTLIGLIVFVECQLILIALAFFLRRRQNREPQPVPEASERRAGQRLYAALALAAAAGALSPLFALRPTPASANASASVDWPTFWNGLALTPQPMPQEVAEYLSDFPGEWAQFRHGTESTTVLLRLCERPTRKLHSAENCYLAMGGTCEPSSSQQFDDGHVWSRFTYTAPDFSRVYVRQCYFSIANPPRGETLEEWLEGAESWPDISAWYWAAAVPGSDVELTLAVTVASRDRYR
jgi:exosortase/archaeosortase family protein